MKGATMPLGAYTPNFAAVPLFERLGNCRHGRHGLQLLKERPGDDQTGCRRFGRHIDNRLSVRRGIDDYEVSPLPCQNVNLAGDSLAAE
jgi:hypothetical protein